MKTEAVSTDHSTQKEPVPIKAIPLDLMERLHLGITALIQYIEAAPDTLLWFADQRTPVESLPDFKCARQAASELKILLNPLSGSGPGFNKAGHLKIAEAITGRKLSCTIFPNDDETVTLTFFEGNQAVLIDLNEAFLRQLIELLGWFVQ